MLQASVSPRCGCCGLPNPPQSGEDCPNCQYPIAVLKEQRFLEASIHNLERAAIYGGANQTIGGLIQHYHARLNYLRQLKGGVGPTALPALVAKRQPQPSPRLVAQETHPARPQENDTKLHQAITPIGLLGAFLILMGALSSVVSTGGNPLQSFLIVFGVHAFFGIAGVIAYRFANFRLIARIYIGIYTLLVPLLGLTAYNLVLGSHIHLSAPTLVAIAAGYAAIVYTLLAVYQRFALFGYLGAAALVVVDLAIALDVYLGYWWWPTLLMLLALPTLVSVVRAPNSGRERFFKGSLAILREPVRVCMYVLVSMCLIGIVCTSLYSFLLDVFALPLPEVRIALLSMAMLLLLWTSIWLWLTKRARALPVLVVLFLLCLLAFAYACAFSRTGYTLVLIATALLYHGLSRFAGQPGRPLAPFGQLCLRLDRIALLLVCIVPLVASWSLPQQLFLSAYGVPFDMHVPLSVQADWNTAVEALAVAIGCMITISMAVSTPMYSGAAAKQHTWLLLVSGCLLIWEFSISVLLLHLVPAWCFVGLAVALSISGISVRRLFGTCWSHPLDVVVLAVVLLSLSLGLNMGADPLAALLSGYAVFTYAVLLVQRRQNLLFLPVSLAACALPLFMSSHPYIVLLLAIGLPLAAVIIRRGISLTRASSVNPAAPQAAAIWEWPLFAISLLYAIALSAHDAAFSVSTMQGWLHVPVPVAFEIGAFALLALVIVLVERIPELLLLPVGLAAWAIWQWQPQLSLASLMLVYSLLCVLIFASQFVWQAWPPHTDWLPATFLHRILSIGGQALLILLLIAKGGLSSTASGNLPFIGAGMLLVLALLVFWYGQVQSDIAIRRLCAYGVSLAGSLALPWLLVAFHQTNIALLLLVPASCLIVIAPLMMRDELLPYHYTFGQAAAILGAALLLLPTLWLSFNSSDSNLLYTLLLLGEALHLSLLGIGIGVRVFALSGSAFLVLGALHALFLPALGIPVPLALTIIGITLLAIATALSLVNHRLQLAWKRWD